jgi:CRP/FNR family transcriptional regulator, cyclic AMP receptor protein
MNPVHALEEHPLGRVRELKIEDFLRKMVIFKDLSAKSIHLIANRIQTLTVKKGTQVISEDEVAKGVFFIHTGAVKLTKQDEGGNEIIVCMKQKGDVFAEA